MSKEKDRKLMDEVHDVMRLHHFIEAVRLRVHDIDFTMKQINVRSGKGDKDRS